MCPGSRSTQAQGGEATGWPFEQARLMWHWTLQAILRGRASKTRTKKADLGCSAQAFDRGASCCPAPRAPQMHCPEHVKHPASGVSWASTTCAPPLLCKVIPSFTSTGESQVSGGIRRESDEAAADAALLRPKDYALNSQ